MGRERTQVKAQMTGNTGLPEPILSVSCGYWTPRFTRSMLEGYFSADIRTQDKLDDQLCGNLCRCTGYRPIRDAAIEAFSERHRKNGEDFFAKRLKAAVPDLKEAEFDF